MSFIQLPPEQPSALSRLLTGFGTGLGAGLQEGIQGFFDRKKTISALTPILGEKKAKAVASAPKEFQSPLFKTLLEEPKLKEKTLAANREKAAKFFQQEDKARQFPDPDALRENIFKLVNQGADPFEAVSQVVRDSETPDTLEQALSKPLSDKNEQGVLSKGVRASIAGRATAIANGVPFSEYEKSISIENPSLLDTLGFSGARLAANAPILASGGILGAQAGGALGGLATGPAAPFGAAAGAVVGGGAGAFGLEALLDNALREFHEFKEKGGEGGFEEFIERGARVAAETGQAAITGGGLGILSRAIPALKGIPALASLFERAGKPVEVAAGAAIETAGLLGLEAARKGELPSKQDVAATLLTVAGFKAAEAAPRFSNRILSKVQESPLPLEETATRVSDQVREKGIDMEKVNAGVGAEEVKFDRIVRDVTKEARKEKAVEVFEEKRPELRLRAKEEEAIPVGLREKKPTPPTVLRETSIPKTALETIGSKRPETLIKEQVRLQELTPKINKIQEDVRRSAREINQVREAIEKTKDVDIRAKLESRQELGIKRLKDLQKDLRGIEKELKTGISPKSDGAIRTDASSSIENLEKAIAEGKPEKAQIKEAKIKAAIKRRAEDAASLRKLRKDLSRVPQDTYTRIKDLYKDVYEERVNDLKDFIGENEFDKSPKIKKEVTNARKTVAALNDRISGIKDDLTIHKHKLKAAQEESAKIDKLIKVEEKGRRARVEEAAKPAIKEANLRDQVQDTFDKPTKENVEKLASKTGATKEQWKGTIKDVGDIFKKAGEKLNKGKSATGTIGQASNLIMKALGPLPIPEKLKRALATGIVFWGIQELTEFATGYRPPASLIALVSPGKALGRLGASVIANLIKKGSTKLIEQRKIDNFREVIKTRSTPKIRAHEKELRNKGLSQTQINNLRKKAMAA